MSISIEYKGWEFEFDEMPSSEEIEERYRQRVERTEIEVPVPRPTPLERRDGALEEEPLAGRTVAYRAGASGPATRAAVATLVELGAEVGVSGPELGDDEPMGPGSVFEPGAGPEVDEWDGLVYDAAEIDGPGELKGMQAFFREHLVDLADCGRVVVIGRPVETAESREEAAGRRALDGFVRSVAKEVGRSGATANRLVVEEGAEGRVAGPLRFLTTDRSAYVSAQTLRIRPDSVPSVDDPGTGERFGDKTVVATGVGRGIGRALAERFHAEGARVLGVDLPESDAFDELEEIGIVPVGLDIASDEAPDRLAELAEREEGFDAVVHNAGVTRDASVMTMAPEEWRQPMEVNLEAPLRTTARLADRGALTSGARVVLVSSVTGMTGNIGQANYATSKAGLLGWTDWAADPLERQGVALNAVAPGFVETGINESLPEQTRAAIRRMNALGQPGEPVDVANAIAFLASPAARGIRRETLRVCGGAISGA